MNTLKAQVRRVKKNFGYILVTDRIQPSNETTLILKMLPVAVFECIRFRS